ncbi:MAG: SGNH/GDSL hydrolase family protein [Magnetococcus sp. THC-1_WYH]
MKVSIANIWKNALLVASSIVFFLVLAELALRWGGFESRPTRFGCPHPVLRAIYCPKASATFTRGPYEYTPLINAEGFYDHDYPRVKTPGTERIAVLGDSFAESLYLPLAERFDGIWEARLPAYVHHPVEVINFSVGGNGTWDQWQIYHLITQQYRPDWVVLPFFLGNDVKDNIERLLEGNPNPLRNEYDTDSFKKRFKMVKSGFNDWLWNHFLLYQLLREESTRIRGYFHWSRRPDFMKTPVATTPHTIVTDTRSTYDDVFFWDSAGWSLTRELLRGFQEEVTRQGGQLVVIDFPSLEQVGAQPALPLEEFHHFLDSLHIPHQGLYDFYAAMEASDRTAQFIPEDGHWTRRGHRDVALATLPFLADLLRASGR